MSLQFAANSNPSGNSDPSSNLNPSSNSTVLNSSSNNKQGPETALILLLEDMQPCNRRPVLLKVVEYFNNTPF